MTMSIDEILRQHPLHGPIGKWEGTMEGYKDESLERLTFVGEIESDNGLSYKLNAYYLLRPDDNGDPTGRARVNFHANVWCAGLEAAKTAFSSLVYLPASRAKWKAVGNFTYGSLNTCVDWNYEKPTKEVRARNPHRQKRKSLLP